MDPSIATERLRSTRRIEPHDPSFPVRLRDLPSLPEAVWVRGSLPEVGARLVAVVGSRAATRAGVARVTKLASELTRAGWQVISGGALGIDAAAHRGALEAGGPTFAVLGCGIDQVYPDRHGPLFDQIVVKGGLLSEYGPGTPPRPGQFPARNRLVAVLADAVIVGESGLASGALITAGLGWRFGRPLLALPGSPGADCLIAAGRAAAVETPADALAVLAGGAAAVAHPPVPLSPVLEALRGGPAGADVVATRLGVTLAQALGLLAEAELEGYVTRVAGGRFEGFRGN